MLQNNWHTRKDGQDYVCLAAAWSKPGTVTSVDQCPAILFPRWVWNLMPTLDDGIESSQLLWLFTGFSDRAELMATFTQDQWEKVCTKFLIKVIDLAVGFTEKAQPVIRETYWIQVQEACKQTKVALISGNKESLRSAAYAADAAMNAAAYAAMKIAEAFFTCVDNQSTL